MPSFRLMASVALLSSVSLAQAQDQSGPTAIALSGDRTLHMIDASTAAVTGTLQVEGIDRLLGIDLRPSTGQLIGVSSDFEVVEIDTTSGKATVISTMDKPLPIGEGASVVVDFNPMADKLRFMSGTTNHRVDVDTGAVTVDGELAFESADMHAGEAPGIVAAAYINAFGKPEKTAMYNIDETIVAVIQQTAPNEGTLKAVGKLGIDASESYAFDIATDEAGTNIAWLAAGGMLHTVSLETGAVGDSWKISGTDAALRDIAFMPKGM